MPPPALLAADAIGAQNVLGVLMPSPFSSQGSVDDSIELAANLGIEPDDFEYAPFAQEGGLGKVHQLFGDKLNAIIEELIETLAA